MNLLEDQEAAALSQRIAQLLRDRLGVQRAVDAHSDLVCELQLDSMQRLTLVVELENTFEVCFDAEDEHELRSVDDLARAIARKRAAG